MDLQTKIRLNGDTSEQSSSEQSQQPADLFQQESHRMDHSSSGLPRDIPFHLLEEITDGFSNERKLGSGAFGKVYMGVHNNGEKIAVKMLYDMPGLEEEQFLNEFHNLASLQHPNIVRLVGYCHEIQNKCVEYNGRLVFAERICRALCFEYMRYGSLDKYLSDEYHGFDWNTRYAIIKGICNGLKYLHEELKSPIYHLDLKPANILLDENMMPKICDFGLSRFFGEEPTQITRSCIGTYGYIPPEYIERNIISNKFDIFSLGVVIIKIMTGSKGYIKSAEMSPQQFIELVHKNWMDRLHATIPMHFLESYSKQVKRCVEVALNCVEVDRHRRPSVGDIVKNLKETETTIRRSSQFSHRLGHDDRGSSIDQVCRLVERMSISVEPFQVPQLAFSRGTLQQRLQAIIEGSIDEAWTCAIFWQSSVDAITGSSCLSWDDGYYKGCDRDEKGPSKRQPTTPAVQAEQEHRKRVLHEWIEQEHRKRVLHELHSLFCGNDQNAASTPTPASREEEVSDELWSNLTSVMQSFVDSSGVRGQEQQHRKNALRELSSLLSGYPAACDLNKDPDMEDVTDTEWFFLVSMSQFLPASSSLPGNALLAARPIWITTALSDAPCQRACQAYTFGLRTMVCIPIGTGVLELDSTNFIFQTTESIPRILSLFNQATTEL